MAGVGVAMMTYWDVHEQLARKELKRLVLADAEPMELGIWAIFPTRRHMPVRVRAFIDVLRERLLAGTGRRDPG
jgi:DNA-binding transcriptional LysR family regulator